MANILLNEGEKSMINQGKRKLEKTESYERIRR
jgi:hypothetical protein